MRLSRKRPPALRSGVTAVEFALTAPVLFLIVFGLIEIARLYQVSSACSTAAIAAAREAAIVNANAEKVRAVAGDLLRGLGASDHQIDLSPAVITATTPQVAVSVTAPLTATNGFLFTQFVKGKSVSRTVVRTLQHD